MVYSNVKVRAVTSEWVGIDGTLGGGRAVGG